MILLYPVAIAAIVLWLALTNETQPLPHTTPNHAPTQHCTTFDCPNPVTVHIPAGHDLWPFCATCGPQYLTQDMTR